MIRGPAHRARLACLAAFGAGCTGDALTRFLEPPPAGAVSAVVSMTTESGRTITAGVDLAGGWRFQHPIPDDVVEVRALLYRCPLPVLGLRAAELVPAEGRRLPVPREVWTRSRGDAAWTRADTMPDDLAATRFDLGPPPCARFEQHTVTADRGTRGAPIALVPMSARRALVAYVHGEILVFDADGTVEPWPDELRPPGPMADARIDAADRVTWLTAAGCLWRGPLGGAPSLLGCSPIPKVSGWSYVAPSPPDAAEDLLFYYEGSLERWDGEAVTVLATAPEQPGSKAGIARLPDGEVLAGGGAWDSIYRVRDGAVTTEVVLIDTTIDKIVNVGHSKALGLVAATNLGYVFAAQETGQWHRLEQRIAGQIRVLLGFGEGVMIGGFNGGLNELLFDGTVCPELTLSSDVRRLAAHGRELIGLTEIGDVVEVSFMERLDDRPECE